MTFCLPSTFVFNKRMMYWKLEAVSTVAVFHCNHHRLQFLPCHRSPCLAQSSGTSQHALGRGQLSVTPARPRYPMSDIQPNFFGMLRATRRIMLRKRHGLVSRVCS
jgi:hypothetical protein